MRLDLAQYRELEAFAQFGSGLDKTSQAQIDRGERTVELLKQPQYSPVTLPEAVASIWAVTKGHLDDIPVVDVRRFEQELIEFLRTRHAELLDGFAADGKMTDERDAELQEALKVFTQQFEPSEVAEEEEHVTMEELDTLSDDSTDRSA